MDKIENKIAALKSQIVVLRAKQRKLNGPAPNDVWLRLKAPYQLIECADERAAALDISLSGFVRAAMHAVLEAQGMRPPPLKPPRIRNAKSLRRVHEDA
jgi:hypothetical protein